MKRKKEKEWGDLQREKAREGVKREAGAGGPVWVGGACRHQGTGRMGGGLGSLWSGQSRVSQEWVGFVFGTPPPVLPVPSSPLRSSPITGRLLEASRIFSDLTLRKGSEYSFTLSHK